MMKLLEKMKTGNVNYKTQKGDTIAVALTPLPGKVTNAWIGHFQMGRRGGSKDEGSYVSRRCYLTHDQAAAIIMHFPFHTRSIRTTSTTIYQLLASHEGTGWRGENLKAPNVPADYDHTPIELAQLSGIDSFRLLSDWIRNLKQDNVDDLENSTFNTGWEKDVAEELTNEVSDLKQEVLSSGLVSFGSAKDEDTYH